METLLFIIAGVVVMVGSHLLARLFTKQDLERAKREGYGAATVATAALVLNADANYRIANAQTSMANTMRLQALQAQTPIRCNYTLPGRYGNQGYIFCH